jgi:hypothetical protein
MTKSVYIKYLQKGNRENFQTILLKILIDKSWTLICAQLSVEDSSLDTKPKHSIDVDIDTFNFETDVRSGFKQVSLMMYE